MVPHLWNNNTAMVYLILFLFAVRSSSFINIIFPHLWGNPAETMNSILWHKWILHSFSKPTAAKSEKPYWAHLLERGDRNLLISACHKSPIMDASCCQKNLNVAFLTVWVFILFFPKSTFLSEGQSLFSLLLQSDVHYSLNADHVVAQAQGFTYAKMWLAALCFEA